MRNIRRRLKGLSKSFPLLNDTRAKSLAAAALASLSNEVLLLLGDIIDKQELSPVPPLTEPELRALEEYNSAFELASRQARLA
jgi:hypothetical protein